MTKDEVTTRILELTKGHRGWTVRTADDPMTAEEGYAVFHGDDTEPTVVFKWPIFDKALKPLVNVVTDLKEMWHFAQKYADAVDCSDAHHRLVGLAKHDTKRGHALVCQIRISDVKRGWAEHKTPFLKFRDQKLAEAATRREARELETAALQDAIILRAELAG